MHFRQNILHASCDSAELASDVVNGPAGLIDASRIRPETFCHSSARITRDQMRSRPRHRLSRNEERKSFGRRNSRGELFEETLVKSENLYLVRRREMLQMLREACAEYAAASVIPDETSQSPTEGAQSPTEEPTAMAEGTTFLKFGPDYLWIARPDAWSEAAVDTVESDPLGHELCVGFLRREGRFAFKAVVTQQRTLGDHPLGPIAGLRLAIPLRLGRVETRQDFRLQIPDELPLNATLTSTAGRRESWDLQIKDVSSNGLGGTLLINSDEPLARNTICWAEVPIDTCDQPLSFMVRLRHVRANADQAALVTGWELCPSDDSSSCQRKLQRLQAYLNERLAAVA